VWPQSVALFIYVTLKQLNSLTLIEAFCCLGGLGITQCERCRVRFPALARIFRLALLFWCCCVFAFLFKNIIVMIFCNSFYSFNSFSILNILHNLWPIIRVSSYTPSIFKVFLILLLILCNIMAYLERKKVHDILKHQS